MNKYNNDYLYSKFSSVYLSEYCISVFGGMLNCLIRELNWVMILLPSFNVKTYLITWQLGNKTTNLSLKKNYFPHYIRLNGKIY